MKHRHNLIKILILILLIIPIDIIDAKLLEYWKYEYNQCELIAKEYQKEYWGNLIFIQPLKENGAFDLGEYNGHFLNKAYSKERGIYYIDYYSGRYFNDTDEIIYWYYVTTGKNSVVYNLNEEHPPFPLIWHY